MLLTLLQNSGTSPTAYTISCSKVTYALTGKDATLTFSAGAISYSITASKGAYSLTGKDADFKVGRSISSEKGVYTLSGKVADFKVGRSIGLSKGAFSLTGKDANLVYSAATNYNLLSSKGVYTLTGKNANLIYSGTGVSYSLSANKNTYLLNGSLVYLNLNFTQAITYLSSSFVMGRIRVYNGTIWQDVKTYQYKNNKWNGFTK
jgi:hypothetical protein